jgi:maltooligosyltrehalose trehalohydrolase
MGVKTSRRTGINGAATLTMSAEITNRDTCLFRVWAPEKNNMTLHLTSPGKDRKIPMHKDERGYFSLELPVPGSDKDPTPDQAHPMHGDTYFFIPGDAKDLPDPGSHFQPGGVHGASAIVDHSLYHWQDSAWRGAPFHELIFYELHVGAFTPAGSFEAIIPLLDDIAAVGINAIELMPVAQFPGDRNWGYDGVYPYAVQNTYGGPQGLKRLVDACHQRGLSVFLDVVYNHLGPEGNYFEAFGPYFTGQYHTPWGPAMNFDGKWSDGVRDYFIQNALHWFNNYHIDGLRVDAIHEVYDRGAVHFWEQVHEEVRSLAARCGRPLYLVAESDLNSPRVIRPPQQGGYGFDAQWLDDFHHALYVFLDRDGLRHYRDFGRLEQLAKAYQDGFVHSGEYVQFRQRKHGASSAGISGDRFVVFNQNHDLPGNRPGGERLSALVDFERLQLAAGALLLSPYIPLLFMGEEYGEDAPFYFFSDYGDKKVAQQLKEGRKKQFADFEWGEEGPDSQELPTFLQSKLQWELRKEGKHARLLDWYKRLILLRKAHPLLKDLSKNKMRVGLLEDSGIGIDRQDEDGQNHLLCLFNFSERGIPYELPGIGVNWVKLLDSKEKEWTDRDFSTGREIALAPLSVTVYATI